MWDWETYLQMRMDAGQGPSTVGKKLAVVPHYYISERLLWSCGELPQIEQISVAQHMNSPWSVPPPPKKKRKKGKNWYNYRTIYLQGIQYSHYKPYSLYLKIQTIWTIHIFLIMTICVNYLLYHICFSFLQSQHITKVTLKDPVSENQTVLIALC